MKERIWFAVVILLFSSLGGWIGYMAIDNDPPFQYLNEGQGSYISPNPAMQESMVSTHWELTDPKKDCPRQVERIFTNRDTNQVVTTLDATPMSRIVQVGNNKLSRSFQLPPGLPAKTGFRARVCFQCNVLQMFFPVCTMSPELTINLAN